MRRILVFVLGLWLTAEGTTQELQPPPHWVTAARDLPVWADGRVQPWETWAQRVYGQITGETKSPKALSWLLAGLLNPVEFRTQALIGVRDPQLLRDVGIAVPGPGRYSLQDLETLRGSVASWLRWGEGDSSPQGQERVRLAQAFSVLEGLASTWDWNNPVAKRSPFRVIQPGPGAQNPAEALAANPQGPGRDELALLLLWRQSSLSEDWVEAEQALALYPRAGAGLELFYQAIPWTGIGIGLAVFVIVGARVRPGAAISWIPGLLGLVITGTEVVLRMVLSGRPPVTSLPSSFLLVALALWAVAALPRQIALAKIRGMFAGTAAALSALASWLEQGTDPFGPLPPVLNSSFWLTFHVPTIVLGYAATLVAALLGHGLLLAEAGKPRPELTATLYQWLRRLVLTALVLTSAGTLLGGIWADQSWGQFWSWDPKENGALLIILAEAIILHLRPAGLAQTWGTALGAAALFLVLLLSWLGTNLLGVGMHSYGALTGHFSLFLALFTADFLFLTVLTLRKVLR